MTDRRRARWIVSCALLVAALAAGGCRKAGDAATEALIEGASGQKVDLDRDGGRITLKGEQGAMTMQAGDALPLPEDFPKDVYLPERYTVSSVMDMGGMRVVSLQSAGNVSDLFADARGAMTGAGWKQTMAMQHSVESAMLSFEKEERNAILSFNKGERADTVMVSVQMRQDKPPRAP